MRRLPCLVSLVCVFVTVSSDVAQRNAQLDRLLMDTRIRKRGDAELGGLFSIHTDLERRSLRCSGYDLPSILMSQAMIYEVDRVNADEKLLPGLTLGYEMMDDCYNMDLAVKAGAMFLMGESVLDRRRWILEYRKRRIEMAKGSGKRPKIKSPKAAVIGPSNTDTATAVASMASVNLLPVISYAATSSELSQKKKYPSFLRTVPADTLQVSAMADLIRHFNWTWISAVGTDDAYGQFGLQALKGELLRRNICLAKELLTDYRLTKKSIEATLEELFNESLAQRVEVVVLIVNGAKITRFLNVLKQQNIFNKTWIASESWGYREIPIRYKDVVSGSLGLAVDTPEASDFIKYVNGLRIADIQRTNPWFYDYLVAKRVVNPNTPPDNKTLLEHDFVIDADWFYPATKVLDAVRATAVALHRLVVEQRKSVKSLFPIDLLRSLRQGTYTSSYDPSRVFSFDKDGDLLATSGYRITNLKAVPRDNTMRFESVGSWSRDGEYVQLVLDEDNVDWSSGSNSPPESNCQKECLPGTYKIFGGTKCCWSCSVCPANEYSTTSGATCCKKCPQSMVHNEQRTGCVFRSDYAYWKSAGELVTLVVAVTGMVVDVAVASILFRYRRTPVVVCSNAPLTFILLYLLGTAFTLPLLYVLRPSVGLCFAETVYFGWTFSTITAIFFTKTYHVLQIFTAKLSHTLHLLSQRGLQRREIWLSLGLGAVVLLPTVPYLVVHEPTPPRNDSGDCGVHWVNVQLMNMAYIALLSLATTYVSFRARNLPENYNEAHSVATTMLMLLLVWLSSLPSYYRVSMSNRALILGLAVDAAAFCILAVIFLPKLYLIFFEPHKNTPLYVSRMNMIHLWKQHSKKRSSDRPPSNDSDDRSGSPTRKRFKCDPANKILRLARRALASVSIFRTASL